MIHGKLSLNIVLIVCVIGANVSFAQDTEYFKRGVVKIAATTFEGKRKIGTGFIVQLEPDAAYIVTASHVVEGASDIEVEFFTRRNRLIPADVLSLEGGDPQGLALLLLDTQIPANLTILPLSSSMQVRGGDTVTTIGFPRISEVSWAVIRGDIVGQKGKSVTFSGAVDEGNSGGPLIKDGQVIGIVTEVRDRFAYAVPTLIAQYVLGGWGVALGTADVKPTATPESFLVVTAPTPISTATATPRPRATPMPTLHPTATPPALPTTPPASEPVPGQEYHDPVSGIDFVYVPEGCFRMGSPESEEKHQSNEGPVHEVCLDGFWMGKYEVTQRQWQQVMGRKPAHFKGDSLPVEQVSWDDAQEFLQKLNTQAGREIYRLPSEAEWEYAARAGTTTPFYFGETISTDQANYAGNYTYGSGTQGEYREQTTEVGTFPSNVWGLYDMHGNVWEWCQDWYGSDYYSTNPKESPKGPETGEYRVLRGGSWINYPSNCRSADRGRGNPAFRGSDVGFRVVAGVVAWTL